MTRTPFYPAALLLAAALAFAGPADAQTRRGPGNQAPYGGARHQQPAWDNGYRQGIGLGERDAQAGRRFDVRGTREYRSADRGYDRRYGDRGHYRDVFRQGFEAGYRAGYERMRSGRAVPRPQGRYPDYGYGYPDTRQSPGYRGGGYLYSVASDRGFSDGFEKGLADARSRRHFDPGRHKWYRSGNRGFNRRYGAKHEYRAVYRDAFRAGYERAFRERNPYGRERGGWRWPF